MKITHVLPLLTKGGGERVAVDLANQAVRDGHEVAIIAAYPADPAQLRNSLHPSIDVKYVSDVLASKLVVYLSISPWIWRNRSWLTKQDILHCHMTYGAIFGVIVCFTRPLFHSQRPAIVETYHSVGMHIPALHRWAHTRMAASFDALALVAEDDYWRAFINDRPALPSAIIPNGISFQRLASVDSVAQSAYRREIGIPDECCYVVGTVGRLRPDRKPWLYIPIFAEIVRAFGPEVHFVVAGGGSEYDHMRLLIVEQGLEKQVHLLGPIIKPRLSLSVMDIYITLNVGAVTGIAALEAAYLGVPVLAIQMCSNYRAKPDDWIWSSTNLSDVARRAIELLRNQSNRQALAMRQATYVRSHHTIESMARSYDTLYQAAIERTCLGRSKCYRK